MRRSRVAVYLHLVWATWDRQPFLRGNLERRVHRAIAAKCEELHAEIVALGGVEDHVHLLVGLPATISIAELVRHLKGATSRLASEEFINPKHEFFKWQGAYGAFSVSPRHLTSSPITLLTNANTTPLAPSSPTGNRPTNHSAPTTTNRHASISSCRPIAAGGVRVGGLGGHRH